MNQRTIPIQPDPQADRERKRRQPKGRAVDPAARADIAAWFGAEPWPRDRLIEALRA